MDAVKARHDDGRIDLTTDDEQRPILLAVSDNGPQMTSGSTREFLALCAEEDLASDGRIVGRRTLPGGHVTTVATQRCLPQ
ncbi:MAG TPA: ATP-binding protein [Kineosporiaceae bacterium]